MTRIPILQPGVLDPFPPVESAVREPEGAEIAAVTKAWKG